ncbi:unnamed protein product [Brassica oleracea var. botrytis]|uniref:(rape) hypothetical protein n=1 Tax=Brassica napus TaxID=3708 RepID=A0A816ITP3_BRANA|nr:unnamed protein product [Brassica napus]
MDSAAPPGSPVSPTRDRMVTEVRDEGSTLESSKDEFAQISKVGIVEKSLEAGTQKEENPAGEKVVVTSDETSSWALVSPAKMGRSPARIRQRFFTFQLQNSQS